MIYSMSRNRIEDVADVSAGLIDWLDLEFKAPISLVSISGHSLG